MIDRRHFTHGIAAASLGLGLAPHRARAAAQFTFKVAHPAPASHPLHIELLAASERMSAGTQGRFALKVFPSDQLGSQMDVLAQVRSGAIDVLALSGVVLSTLVPASAISGMAFAFKDNEAVWKAMDGDLGAFIRAEIDKTGSIFAFEKSWDNGYRQITSSTRAINAPDDLSGMKIRVPPSPMWVSLFKALGASPASINANELYSSLQTRIVDAQENPLAVVDTLKLYEVQKYCAITNHMWDGFWILGNRRNYEALPADVKAVVAKEFNLGAIAERTRLVELNVSVKEDLVKKGLQFTNPPIPAFREKLRLAGFYAEWKTKFPAVGWAALEAAAGNL